MFSTNSAEIRKKVSAIIQKSPSCAGMHERLDQVLVLADRLVASCVGDPAFGDLPRRIERILGPKSNDNQQKSLGTDILKDCCEAFLKAILYRSNPNAYQELQLTHPKGPTLFTVIRELRLLTQQELDLPLADAKNLGDRAKSAVLTVRYLRNEVSHLAPEYEPEHEESSLQSALTTMLVSIDKSQEQLRTNLRPLITRPLKTPEQTKNALQMVRSERERHLRKFKGRGTIIDEIKTHIEKRATNEGGYILVTAPEGFGKSALTARLSELIQPTLRSLGGFAGDTTKTCPWLPSVIYHTGKQETNAFHFIETIIHQVNCLLIRPVGFERPHFESRVNISSTANAHSDSKGSDSDSNVSSLDDHRVGMTTVRSEKKSESAEIRLALRAALHSCLERLTDERGQAILLFDSLDELNLSTTDVTLFPQALPRGVAILLVSRDVQATVEIRRYLQPAEYVLEGLNLDEVRQLTQVNDDNWNETALKSSGGAPLYILTLADAVKKAGGDHTQVDPSVGPSEILDRQVKQWRIASQDEEKDSLYRIMLLLAVFEPVASVDLDLIKGFLLFTGTSLSRNQIRELLREVSSQVDGLNEGKVKLAVRAFASYVCSEVCGKKDLRQFILRTSQWLAQEEDANAELLASFLKQWTTPKLTPDPTQRENAKRLVSLLQEARSFARLCEIYHHRPTDEDETPEIFLKCLKLSAAGGDAEAASALGRRILFDNEYGENAWPEGESWLRNAISTGDNIARIALGTHLIYSYPNDETRLEEGVRLIREAAQNGDTFAMTSLGNLYINGTRVTHNPVEGEQLLQQAVASGDEDAMLILGQRLLDGNGIEQDTTRGEYLLREATLNGSNEAMLFLGRRLITGRNLTPAPNEGEAWLSKATRDGNTDAMIELGERFIEGRGLPQSVERGVHWLKQAILEGNPSAMMSLGIKYMDGDNVPKTLDEGERLLREAARKMYPPAMLALALRMIDGDGVHKSAVEGRQLLFKAAQKRHPPAMSVYGNYLIDGEGFKKDVVEGYKWLLMASNTRLPMAMPFLGERIIEGQIVGQSKIDGEKWLRRAIRDGSTNAKVSLANYILNGKLTPSIPDEGRSLLDSAAGEGNVSAMGALAYRLRLGDGIAADEKLSDHWLAEATQEGDSDDILVALTYYIRGRMNGAATDLEAATKIFLTEAEDSMSMASNLAYMIRRGETGSTQTLPPLEKLLDPGVTQYDAFSVINEALRQAAGIGCTADWHRADTLMSRLKHSKNMNDIQGALEWWSLMLNRFDDGEGHLVIGLLCRHGLIQDPHGLSVRERLLKANERGWSAPSWLELPAHKKI